MGVDRAPTHPCGLRHDGSLIGAPVRGAGKRPAVIQRLRSGALQSGTAAGRCLPSRTSGHWYVPPLWWHAGIWWGVSACSSVISTSPYTTICTSAFETGYIRLEAI